MTAKRKKLLACPLRLIVCIWLHYDPRAKLIVNLSSPKQVLENQPRIRLVSPIGFSTQFDLGKPRIFIVLCFLTIVQD